MSKSVKFKFFNNKNGKSKGIYSSLNCGLKSQDNLQNVKKTLNELNNKYQSYKSKTIKSIWLEELNFL